MNICPSLITWIIDYHTLRPQFVRLNLSVASDVIIINTGAPQGTVLSTFLFSLNKSDCRVTHNNCMIDKYAHHTVLTGMDVNDDCTNYIPEVKSFVDWCDANHLVLSKTKEMIIDFCKKAMRPGMTITKDKEVERVDIFKYLGVTLDNKLTWRLNTKAVVKKTKPQIYCVRNFPHSMLIETCFNCSIHL